MQVADSDFEGAVGEIVQIADRFDVDVLHAEALYCARVALLVRARLPDIFTSVDWHGAVPEESRMGGAHENRVRFLETDERRILEVADLNVFVSGAMARHYDQKYAVGTIPQVVVPCCVSDKRFPDSKRSVDLEFDKGSLIFSYVGSMADWQCGLEMVKLFAALHAHDNSCRFLMLVPEADHEKVRRHMASSGLPEEAVRLHSVAHDEVPKYLATADIGVLLRREDVVNAVSSPTKFGEYLAAGLPVLMTDGVGDFSDLVRRRSLGVIVPSVLIDFQDASSIRPWLARVIDEARVYKSSKESVAVNAQSLVRHELHWEELAMKWLRAYSDLFAPERILKVESRLVPASPA